MPAVAGVALFFLRSIFGASVAPPASDHMPAAEKGKSDAQAMFHFPGHAHWLPLWTEQPSDGGLRRFLIVGGVAVFLLLLPQALLGGYHRVGAEVCGAFVAVVLVGVLVRHLRWRRRGCLVRIDEDAITVTGARTVGWDEICEVREVRRGYWEGLVPVAREGFELPVFEVVLFWVRPSTAAARTARRWGGPLVLLPAKLDVGTT